MKTSFKEPDFQLSTHRIEALGDGVFAIVMTLLILELKVPEVHEQPGALLPSLVKLWPKFLSYVISFVTLGVYWVAHHLHFYSIKKADRALLWINILFFMFVSLVPFTTALVGEYWRNQAAVALFGLNMIFIGLALYLHWIYASARPYLMIPDLSPSLVRTVKHVILMGPIVYFLAIGCSFINTKISLVLYLLVNLLYILPGGAHLWLKHKPADPTPTGK